MATEREYTTDRQTVEHDTGLTEGRQRLREWRAKRWAERITVLMHASGCSAAWAIKAVEDADARLYRRQGGAR